jgi:hypothetical protein
MKNIQTSHTTICQECGELIRWVDPDYKFNSLIDKLIFHMKNDKKCVRERKLNELFETKEK